MTVAFGGFVPRQSWRAAARRLVAVRHPLLLVIALASAWSLHDNVDWGLLSKGARGLFSTAPLSAYARTPGLQAGPPSLVVVRAMNLLPGTAAVWLAHVLLAALGWYMIFLAERWSVAGAGRRPSSLRAGLLTLLIGVPVLVQWGWLAGQTPHPEDGLAIFCFLLAVRAISRGQERRGALLVGLAIAWKPWAVAALPLVWGCSRKRRALLTAIAVPAACWLPFLIGDPATLSVVGHGFVLQPNSPLRALGFSGKYIPDFWRSVELGAALGAAALAARRDWRFAFAAGCATRLLLDPAGYGYYFAGVLMVTALTELLTGVRPWRTVVMWLSAGYISYLHSMHAIYLLQFVVLAIVVLGWTQPWARRAASPRVAVPAPRQPELQPAGRVVTPRAPADQPASLPSL